MPDPLIWSPEGLLRSTRFGDIYFDADGLGESRAVFLAGCGLPQAWVGRRCFTVAELGFGTGLNVLALLDLWRRSGPADARLHVFTVEGFPLSRAQAERALAAFPELADLAALLLARWPRVGRGVERIDLPELRATVDVAIGEAAEALGDWSGCADAWFLDGFAPSRNPEMWRDEVLDLVRARSAPGAALATFTVAGAVRRGLAARGFAVSRAPGHGAKKERLEGRLPGAAAEAPPPTVAVVGAGIAGASLARAFRALGAAVVVVDPQRGDGASGNPTALVSPRLDVGGGPAARLYAQTWARAADLYRGASDAVIAEGALRLQAGPKDAARFETLAGSPLFREGALALLEAEAAGERLRDPADPALLMADALTVSPAAVARAWLEGVSVVAAPAALLERAGGRWRVLDGEGRTLAEADVVCAAAGAALGGLVPSAAVEPVRGQATWSQALPSPVTAASWGGYAVPTPEGGVLFGATHGRGDSDTEVRPEDEAANLAALAARRPALADAAAATRLTSRAAVRATTRDRLPLAGEVEPGLFVLGGLGGRGFTTAPLLAEHVAALATGAPSPLPRSLAAIVDPARFASRAGAARLGGAAEQP